MSYSSNFKRILLTLILVCLVINISFGATLFCNNQNLSYLDNKITCFYSPDKEEYFSPSVSGSILANKIEYEPRTILPNSDWTFKITANLDSTKEGKQIMTINQGNFKYDMFVLVSKKDILTINTNIEYEKYRGIVVLEVKNNSNKELNLDITYNFPENYSAMNSKDNIKLAGNSQISLKVPFEYNNPNYSKGEIIFKYNLDSKERTNKELINFDPYLVPYQEKNSLSPYFLLSNNKVILGLDVLLLLVAIVLFTMFIGRLGKRIVRNNV